MKRGATWLGTAALLLVGVTRLPAAGEVKTSDVMLKSGDEEIKAFLAEPEGKGPFPAVVVIQEWWGLTDWIKDNAKRLAGQGYVALAPDLYRGKIATNPREASELLKGLPKDRALGDLKAAVSDVAGRENVAKDRIGCIGWCMGGGFALQLALHDDRIKACAMCYGRVVTEPDALKPLHAAILGVFGEEDRGIPADDVRRFEEALKQENKKVAGIHLYKAGHGFMRPSNGPDNKNPAYVEEEANKAWKAIDHFFASRLAGKKGRSRSSDQ